MGTDRIYHTPTQDFIWTNRSFLHLPVEFRSAKGLWHKYGLNTLRMNYWGLVFLVEAQKGMELNETSDLSFVCDVFALGKRKDGLNCWVSKPRVRGEVLRTPSYVSILKRDVLVRDTQCDNRHGWPEVGLSGNRVSKQSWLVHRLMLPDR